MANKKIGFFDTQVKKSLVLKKQEVIQLLLVMVMFENRVGNLAVRNNLNRAVIVGQLLGGDEVGVVAVDGAIDTHDAAHLGGNRTDVVRHPSPRRPQLYWPC